MRELSLKLLNPYTMLRDILRNLWVVILAALIGFLGVRAYYNFTYKPVYSSSTTIAISATTAGAYSVSNLSKTIEAAATFQEMFQSSYFKEKLADITEKEITGAITAAQIDETNLISITYSCDSPVDAYTILVAVIENYNAITDHSFSNMIINTISSPSVSIAPANSVDYHNYDKIAAVALAMMVLLVVMLFSYFRDTVKNESDVEELLDAKLFSVIYHEEKNKTIKSKLRFTYSKSPLLVTDMLINYKFAESFRLCALKIEYLMAIEETKTVMVTSCGENEGKTTVAVNVALSLATRGKKTLLIDADLRKPAVHKFFKSSSDETELRNVGEIIGGKASLNDSIILDKKSGLFVLCGQQKYRNSSEMLSSSRFKKFIEAVRDQFDIVVIDTPPMTLVSDAEIIAPFADSTFIVVRQDVAPVPQVNDMIDALTQAETTVTGCIFNDVHVLPGAEEELPGLPGSRSFGSDREETMKGGELNA